MTPSLPVEAAALAARGVREIVIVPIFLGQGGHLLRDLPRLVEELRAAHPGMSPCRPCPRWAKTRPCWRRWRPIASASLALN
jgi:sirohydrochlorin ferrochelatase